MGYRIRTGALGGFLLIAMVSIAFLATDHPPELPSSKASNPETITPTTSTPESQSFSAPHLDTVAESTPPPTELPGARISGFIVDAHGKPMAGMRVDYGPAGERPHGSTPLSGEDGRFEISPLSAGVYALIAQRENAWGDNEAGRVEVTLADNEHRENLLIRLEASASIKGIVVDEQGMPVSGAQIHSGGPSEPHVVVYSSKLRDAEPVDTSDEDGRFVLNNLGPEVTALTAEHPEYALTTHPIQIAAGQSKTVTITMTQGAAIEGMITIDGVPAPNQDISALASSETSFYEDSDASGFYRVERVPEGSVVLRVSRSQNNTRIQQEQTVSARNGDLITVDFDFESGNGGLDGIVTLDGAAPAGGGTVVAFQDRGASDNVGSSATIAEDGSYRMDDLVPGPYRVWVRASAEANANQRTRGLDVEVTADGVTRLDIELPDRHIRGILHGFPEYGRADVFAIDARNAPNDLTVGAPLTPAIKRALSAQSHVQQDGAYDLAGLAEGRYILIVVATNQPSRVATILAVGSSVAVGESNDVEHDISLDWEAALE